MPDFPDNNAKPAVSPVSMATYPCGIPLPTSVMPTATMPASANDPPIMPFGGFEGGFDGMTPFGEFGEFGDFDQFGRRHIFHHHIHMHHHFFHPFGRPFGFGQPFGGQPFGF